MPKTVHSGISVRSDSLPPISSLCLCKTSSDDYLRVKSVLGSSARDLPLAYKAPLDLLLPTLPPYKSANWVYTRPRPVTFKGWVDTLLDPNLPCYLHGETVAVTTCGVHKARVAERATQRTAALSAGEFAFDSEFEGGNLERAAKVGDGEFHLFLSCDGNTKGNTQWFYFSVRNIHKGASITLHIMNLSKSGSPFSRGLHPCILSLTKLRRQSVSWTRGGFNIRYTKNLLPRARRGTYFTLSFSYTFQFDHDTVYFAYSEPYLYTRLMRFLGDLRNVVNVHSEIKYEERSLGETVGGLTCPMVVITDFAEKEKKKVGITARVHPGETVGSFLAEGFLRFITSDSREATHLRRSCIFYVVPMLNPDGVVLGNTRACLTGCDLNRKWDIPDPCLHPIISACKSLLTDSICFIDLHGHSKKDNCFMYGNSFSRSDDRFWTNRFLPIAMAKLTSHFNYSLCYFFNNSSHDKAARTVMFQEKGVLHSFTLEASFHGSFSNEKRSEFTPGVLRDIGWKLGEAIYGLVHLLMKKGGKDTQEGIYSLVGALVARVAGICLKHKRTVSSNPVILACNPEETQRNPEEPLETEKDSSGSDSNPSEDDLDPEDADILSSFIKRLNRKSRKDPVVAETERTVVHIPSSYHFRDPLEDIRMKTSAKVKRQPYLRNVRPAILRRQIRERQEDAQLLSSRGYVEVLNSLRRVGQSLDASADSYLSFVKAVRRETPPKLPPV